MRETDRQAAVATLWRALHLGPQRHRASRDARLCEVGSRSLPVDTAISKKVPIFRDIPDPGKQGQSHRDGEQSNA